MHVGNLFHNRHENLMNIGYIYDTDKLFIYICISEI
jgi:hypothetical protein